ncbi:3-methyl-2-oxobutanoate hydroxymethyltransferase [Catenovulum sp. 2E275]|uniref:3-methyl-2-oxobutanoate hydroxymethyltransferase n=1 Tax=Catenovulum sp. 2E275 TaxID=2980497 RepID=UPI0021D14C31|nr:3-methyl-2-oxobutanoate hydroxymethyltransferase [Catenovulum sp. 2E275]MCU4675355.1 3-methyl-2-oxobutanoate hydroxymethyltransferase [Catenovulum sp. 2E275]
MRQTLKQLQQLKGVSRISMLTAYNCPVARSIEQAGIPIILVGDSVGMVEMGFSSTRDVTMDHMVYHIAAVRRGAPNTHIIGDLPHLSYETVEDAVDNAKRIITAGADSVKLEGPYYQAVQAITEAGIEVCAHTGLTPQKATSFKKVGKDAAEAEQILQESIQLQQAGAGMIVIEHVPAELGEKLTQALTIPTIGIGAGGQTDGQVLVINDALGIGDYWPPFSKQYAHVSDTILKVASQYKTEVETKQYP